MGALPVGHQAESSLWGALTWERISQKKKAFILQGHFILKNLYRVLLKKLKDYRGYVYVIVLEDFFFLL